MNFYENIKAKGVYCFENVQTGEKIYYDNVVCQNFFTQIFKAVKGESSDLAALTFRTGIGTTAALKTDTALEDQQFSKSVSVTYTTTQIKMTVSLDTTESNFVIKECGIFTSSGIISRVNANIDKNAATQYNITYTLTII